jgi:hypothetical protein
MPRPGGPPEGGGHRAAASQSVTGTVLRVPAGPGLDQEWNPKIVVELKVFPGPRTVDGKLGWLGEFGKCCVSNV